jgi:hypothetical protein
VDGKTCGTCIANSNCNLTVITILIFRNMYKNSHPVQKLKPLYSNTNFVLLLARKYCQKNCRFACIFEGGNLRLYLAVT